MGRRKPMRWLGLLGFLAVCLAIGALGSLFTAPQIETWYADLNKPVWNPPNNLFAPVWTSLFVMMAVAGWLVWRIGGFQGAPLALTLFGLQLILNLAWSGIFFGLHQPGWAFLEILLLWVTIFATGITFFIRSQFAGWLFVPYLAWVTFAAALNFTIWQLNLS